MIEISERDYIRHWSYNFNFLFQGTRLSEATVVNNTIQLVQSYGMTTDSGMHEKRDMSDAVNTIDVGVGMGREEQQGGQTSITSHINRSGSNASENENTQSRTFMIACKETTSVVSARKLPKKRKFDPSELEEMEKSNADCSVRNHNIPLSASLTPPPSQSVVVMPPQSTAVDYSKQSAAIPVVQQINHITRLSSTANIVDIVIEDRSGPPQPPDGIDIIHQPDSGNNCLSVLTMDSILIGNARKHSQFSNCRADIDLSEWRDHRVLAKRDKVYLPGVIRKAVGAGEVRVEFDYCEGETTLFTDVLGSGKYDVIGDASPSRGQVQLGARVCVRITGNSGNQQGLSRVFYEGVVYKIHTNPVQFLVKLIGSNQPHEEHLVKRADLRLLLPPWWDELESLEDVHSSHMISSGNSRSFVGSNGQLQQPTVVQATPHAISQLQHVPSFPETGGYYRTAATSPLHNLATPVSIHSASTAHSNGSVDDLRRRQLEDFGESDDDLRKEDIMFPSDAGIYLFCKSEKFAFFN